MYGRQTTFIQCSFEGEKPKKNITVDGRIILKEDVN